jgi:hypothetical protein
MILKFGSGSKRVIPFLQNTKMPALVPGQYKTDGRYAVRAFEADDLALQHLFVERLEHSLQ